MIITLLGRPKSTNHIYDHMARAGKAIKYMNKEASKLKNSYIGQIKSIIGLEKLKGPLFVGAEIYWYGIEPDRDNVHKLSMDSCNGLVREDDSQIQIGLVLKQVKDNSRPRVVIHVLEIGENDTIFTLIDRLKVQFIGGKQYRGIQNPKSAKSAEPSLFN